MMSKDLDYVSFAQSGRASFHKRVIADVNEYFRAANLSPYANTEMWIKTIIMLLLYFVPYFIMVSGLCAGSAWAFFGCWFVMAWGMSGIGTSVMHDASHGTYSANRKVNNFISIILEIIGGYTVNWKIQHNLLHHTYTNIQGLDKDIESIRLLRFSPAQPREWYHRYQHIYVWFFYTIMSLYWMTLKDYLQVVGFRKHNLLKAHKLSLAGAILRITLYKVLYYAYIIVLPIYFSGHAWWMVALGFLLMHFTTGLFLSCVFQPSHIVEASTFAVPIEDNPGEKRHMEDSWAIHEVENTTDFATHNKFLTWFVGGLNYQIEHHLFTGICHVHFPKLAPIVRKAAADFGVRYNVEPTWATALGKHVTMLKRLGRFENLKI